MAPKAGSHTNNSKADKSTCVPQINFSATTTNRLNEKTMASHYQHIQPGRIRHASVQDANIDKRRNNVGLERTQACKPLNPGLLSSRSLQVDQKRQSVKTWANPSQYKPTKLHRPTGNADEPTQEPNRTTQLSPIRPKQAQTRQSDNSRSEPSCRSNQNPKPRRDWKLNAEAI